MMQRTSRWTTVLAVAAGLAGLAVAGAPREEDKAIGLDQALQNNAPVVIKYLRGKGYKNVGVLKFLAQVGDKAPLSDNLGAINRNLADRLEIALILANPDEKLGIIARATDVVKDRPSATHLTERGRFALFQEGKVPFTLAWGNRKPVEPDAFVTGEVRLSSDLRIVRVKVQAFDQNTGDKLDTVCEFQATTDVRTLTDSGISFGARGTPTDKLEMLLVKADTTVPTLADREDVWQKKIDDFLREIKESPVQLEVLYKNEKVPVPIQGNPVRPPSEQANVFLRVREPSDGEGVVSFRVTNKGRETYGVVLMVNGVNTIYREKGEPRDCFKWILKPSESVVVDGFQTKLDKRAPFVVLPPKKAGKDLVNYGDDPGTFSFVVFRGRTKEEDSALVMAEKARDANLSGISRGVLMDARDTVNRNLESLKSDLRREGQDASTKANSKGIIGWDKEVRKEVQQVDFKPYPKPELSVTIRYCDPK
jgi:hypothetical protein